MEDIEPLDAGTPTLARMTYDRLRADVLGGLWQPGRKLLMHELRERYQVGASPLREALNRLASEQWVVHNDQRGFSVAQASQAQLDDLVATRISLESLALAQAFAARRTPEWEEKLVLAFHRMTRTPRSIAQDSYEENPAWSACTALSTWPCWRAARRPYCWASASSCTTLPIATGSLPRASHTSSATRWTNIAPSSMR